MIYLEKYALINVLTFMNSRHRKIQASLPEYSAKHKIYRNAATYSLPQEKERGHLQKPLSPQAVAAERRVIHQQDN